MVPDQLPTPYPSACPPAYSPIYSPTFCVDISPLSRDLQQATAENAELRHQLDQRRLREEAYTAIREVNGDRTFTFDRTGTPRELMDTIVLSACRFVRQPPLSGNPVYAISLKNFGRIIVEESDFLSDSRLLCLFQQRGIQVNLLRSQKTTAALLRTAINSHVQHLRASPYGGWLPGNDGTFSYLTFPDCSTCLHSDQRTLQTEELPSQTSAVFAAAVAQFWPAFNIIRTPALQELIVLLYHEAALHTLLHHLGYDFPLAFCLFSTDETFLAYLRELLSWFSDSSLTLDMAPSDFASQLLFRKDQPLLVEDHGRLDHTRTNTSVLLSALVNRVVPWKNKREIQSLPLQAPITLLSSRPSALSCAPETMVIDFCAVDFDHAVWVELNDRVGHNEDYLAAFCGYTATHISELKSALAEGQKTALRLDLGNLTDLCRKSFGVLIGIQHFLDNFFCFSNLTPSSFPASQKNESQFEQLLDLLVQTSQKSDRTSLADQFIEIARWHIQAGTFSVYSPDSFPQEATKAILFSEDRIFFPPDTFFLLCQSLEQSRPVILGALIEADLLCGAQTNSTTVQTRISVWNEYGIRSIKSVYAFKRSAFDHLGDPLALEEMESKEATP